MEETTNEKKDYRIGVHGCDDSTIFTMALTNEEVKLVERICVECRANSTYGCMPTMIVEPA